MYSGVYLFSSISPSDAMSSTPEGKSVKKVLFLPFFIPYRHITTQISHQFHSCFGVHKFELFTVEQRIYPETELMLVLAFKLIKQL